MSEFNVHIGQMIQAVARKKRLTLSELQDALGTGSRNVSYVFNRPDISVSRLWRISDKMNHNFFADLHPVKSERPEPITWEQIDAKFKTEKTFRIRLEVQYPASLAPSLGSFITYANALGLKMGFKVG